MKIALVQQTPVFLDRAVCIELVVQAINDAASEGARLVVIPETFIPGYPAWLWDLRPGLDAKLIEELHVKLIHECVNLSTDILAPVQTAARIRQVTVVVGIQEVLHRAPRGTIYNSVLTIGPNGEILNVHRKIMPTNPERMAWGYGDARGIRVVDTPVGRVGALICWENMHPLARASLYAQGVEVYVAPTYDFGPRWLTSMQHIAREGGCWVLSCNNAFQVRDLIEAVPLLNDVYSDLDAWLNHGDSCLVTPGGRIVDTPLNKERGIVYGEVDLSRIAAARRTFDASGHYSRPDLFELKVNNNAQID